MIHVTLFETLSIAFLIEALVYIFFLASTSQKKSDSLLITFISVLVLLIVNLFLRFRLALDIPYFYYEFVALLAPLQYLYVKAIVDKEFVFSKKLAIHLVGLGFVLLTRLVIYLVYGSFSQEIFEKYLAVYLFVFAYSYLVLSIRKINQFHKVILHTESNFDTLNLKWLTYEILVLGVFFIALGAEALSIFVPIDPYYDVIVLCTFLSILIFINVLIFKSLKSPIETMGIVKEDIALVQGSAPKYKNSSVSSTESKRLYETLTQFMDNEKPYKNYNLSLKELASQIDFNPAVLSQVVNENSGMNFNDFVNRYRVKEAQALLESGEDLFIKEVMYDSGFHSTSTFHSAFKKKTGKTPTAYRKHLRDNS